MPKHAGPGLRVAVLSCGELGGRVARRLASLPETADVSLLTAPYRHPERGTIERLVRSVRYDGVLDTTRAAAGRAVGAARAEATDLPERGGGPTPSLPSASGVRHRRVAAFESSEGLAELKDLRPDLGVIAGTHILPERVFDLPRLGSVNLHLGRAPEYRGSAPAFWELYHGEDSVGVTVHQVTSELDAGAVLLQESVPLDPAPSRDPLAYVRQYRSEVLEPAGVRLLAEVVSAVARGEAEPTIQDESRARCFPPPTRRDVWRLRARVARRRARRRCGDLAGRALFGAGLHRRLLADRAAVVLYHRVTPHADGNPLACTPEEFERHCAFYDRHFRVVGLEELIERLTSGRDIGRRLAITFDDGYRDNYTLARPILERHDLPACFFVATGFIGSDVVPRWDEMRGERPEWMSWEEVTDLAERGFELGAHTRQHVDLGQVGGERAAREIAASRETLARRIGEEVRFFSYPYGGRESLTDANRRRVRETGFSCCLSAVGGTVSPGTDPFGIPRVPVSDWVISPHHLGMQLVRS